MKAAELFLWDAVTGCPYKIVIHDTIIVMQIQCSTLH